MAVKVDERDGKIPCRSPARTQPAIMRARLPWLDGRSSITSTPLVSSPGHPWTPKEDFVSPLSKHSPSAQSESTPLDYREVRRKLSIVRAEESDPCAGVRSRAGSLVALPDHLARDGTPNSVLRSAQHVIHASVPTLSENVQQWSDQPVPKSSLFELHGNRKLNNAIEGLEYLVEDALATAERTERPEHLEHIHAILEDASHAVQNVSLEPARHLMRVSSPLRVSTQASSRSSSDMPKHSRFKATGVEQHAEASPKDILRNVEQRHSETIDWAYHDVEGMKHHHHRSRSSSSSTSSTSSHPRGRGPSYVRSGSDLLQLLPPQPIATTPHDVINHVIRPVVSRSHSRGRSRQRRSSPGHYRRRHRHHRSWRSDASNSRSSRRRYHHHGLTELDNSFEDEDLRAAGKPQGIKRYGEELHLRDANRHTFGLRRNHRRQPVARNWRTGRKRICAFIACANTAVLGIVIGIYAGEVPRIQYMLADEHHRVIIGNVALYFGLALSTLVSWPLPLLHGRKPYLLASLALAMPLQFPQALVMSQRRSPLEHRWVSGLLVARGFTGLVLGFANVNCISVLFDLFGASLQSKNPHQEFTTTSDVRRHGGGMGLWLGIWSWCWIGSLAGGFQIGAGIIDSLTPDWGFYITIIILASALLVNVMVPETRRSAYRCSVTEVYDRDENYITRRVARGEIKLHMSTEGPKYWFEEVWAGLKLCVMMLCQPGFLVLSLYLGWIYAQIVLVIVLLGALLSRDYKWHSQMVGLGVMSIAIGALIAIPLTKARIFSRERKKAFRTDSMTFQKQVSWSSHLIRRCVFTLVLPLMGLAYTVSSAGRPKPFMVPIVFAGALGFLSILAIAECYGLIMETFDTCDLQPGVNTRHRLQSMAVEDRRRRTNYSSFPRVSAGIFASQALSFVGAAVATEVGGIMTRHIGAQASTGVTAGLLLFLTLALTLVLWRFREVQVIPNHTFGTRRDTAAWREFSALEREGRGKEWRAVVVGTPSGKVRRMSVLEMGGLSRWTEIRKLNFLIRGESKGESERERGGWY